MLFKLHNIISYQPVPSRESEVHSMCGLGLKHILHLIDASN